MARAKKSGVTIRLGQSMSICSEKFAELAEHLRVLKGRIVFWGDIVKDQERAAAVFQDLAASPTSIAGINNNMAYGRIPGHATSTADAVKAYVQSMLESKCATWVQLPPELWPDHWYLLETHGPLGKVFLWAPGSRCTLGKTPRANHPRNVRRVNPGVSE